VVASQEALFLSARNTLGGADGVWAEEVDESVVVACYFAVAVTILGSKLPEVLGCGVGAAEVVVGTVLESLLSVVLAAEEVGCASVHPVLSRNVEGTTPLRSVSIDTPQGGVAASGRLTQALGARGVEGAGWRHRDERERAQERSPHAGGGSLQLT